MTRVLGFAPIVRFDGPVDTAVTSEVAEHAVATLREALANVARHAAATRVEVNLNVNDGVLRLDVTDNGVGFPATPGGPGRGLGNMANRAEKLGGQFTIESPIGSALEKSPPEAATLGGWAGDAGVPPRRPRGGPPGRAGADRGGG